jgi:hypothetical protein
MSGIFLGAETGNAGNGQELSLKWANRHGLIAGGDRYGKDGDITGSGRM